MLLLSLHKAFFSMQARKSWYFSLIYDTSMRLLPWFLEKSHFVNALCINVITLNFQGRMILWNFFRGKTFLRAMFIGLNLIAYENNMQCLNLEQFIKQVNFFFSIVYPNTIFFWNFFDKSFVVSIIFLTFAVSYPYWKLQLGEGGMDIYT